MAPRQQDRCRATPCAARGLAQIPQRGPWGLGVAGTREAHHRWVAWLSVEDGGRWLVTAPVKVSAVDGPVDTREATDRHDLQAVDGVARTRRGRRPLSGSAGLGGLER